MKLMNEVKAEVDGVIRQIHVENAEPVEFGQLLFELEPVNGRPLDAL
jgi:acetyl-CoA carboxylase biotin carboxyl carrier protein